MHWSFHKTGVIGACALGLTLTACGEDSPSDPGGGGNPQGTAATAQVMALVTPLVSQAFIGTYLPLAGSAPGPIPSQCTPVSGVCSTGTVEYCPTSGGATINYDSCNAAGAVTTGSITVAFTNPPDPTRGTAVLGLTVDGTIITGSIFYVFNAGTGCLDQSLSNLAASNSLGSVVLVGSLGFCDLTAPVAPTSGTFSGQITEADGDRFAVNVDIDENGDPGDVTVIISTEDFQTPIATCNGNLLSGSFSCS